MAEYKECEYCGAHLDPAEKCDCRDKKKEGESDGVHSVRTPTGQGQKPDSDK